MRIEEKIIEYEKSRSSNQGAEIKVVSHHVGRRMVSANIKIVWPDGIEQYQRAKYPAYWWDEEELID